MISGKVGKTDARPSAKNMCHQGVSAIRETLRLYRERQELISQRAVYLKENRTLRAHVKHWEDLNLRLYQYIKLRMSKRYLMLNSGNYWNHRGDFGE